MKPGRSYEPDPKWTDACDDRYQRWKQLAGP
jgi:hypothetical protein